MTALPQRNLVASVVLSLLVACGASGRSSETEGGPDAGSGGATCATADQVCVDQDVHACNADGTVGDLIETCPEACSNGSCVVSCGAVGVDKVYVVTDDYRLLRFDPALLPASGTADPAFTTIGSLDCTAGPSLPGWGDTGPATPFSMSVDRDGYAWVLYTSGEIFRVSITDASCSNSGFDPAQQGFELFGMGFVSDAEGSESETLYIAGGPAGQESGAYRLASIDKTSKEVVPLSEPQVSLVGPELTGTGAAELWGYFPGGFLEDATVTKLDKTSAAKMDSYPMDALAGDPRAWAFAQHGGKFYVFITYADLGGNDVPGVKVVNPATPGDITTFSTGNIIVGAGVSTCAPSGPVE